MDEPGTGNSWVTLASLKRPQGRKGELLAELLTDFPESFESRPEVFLIRPGRAVSREQARPVRITGHWLPTGRNLGRVVLAFDGIDSISKAEELAGLEVVVPEQARVPLDDDAEYVSDLTGCSVYHLVNSHELPIGQVIDVSFPMTPDGSRRLEDVAPLLVLEDDAGEEVLVPFAKDFLQSVDVPARRIVMNLPAGLLELNRNPQVARPGEGDLGNQPPKRQTAPSEGPK